MGSSWSNFMSGCKSRLSAVARSCFLSREHWQERCQAAEQREEELRASMVACEARCQQLEQANQDLGQQVSDLQADLAVAELAQPRPVELPVGEVPRGQQYGAGLIALCVNLASKIGIRPTVRILKIFFGGCK